MPGDAVLKSLQQEISASQKERRAAFAAPPGSAEPIEGAMDAREKRNRRREFASEATSFFEEAAKSISVDVERASLGKRACMRGSE